MNRTTITTITDTTYESYADYEASTEKAVYEFLRVTMRVLHGWNKRQWALAYASWY